MRTLFAMLAGSLLLTASVSGMAQQTSTNTNDLRAVVIVARHGVRTPIESETRSGVFNAQPWPAWPTPPGLLTPHGIAALQRMGEFYRQRYGALITSCNSLLGYSTNTPRTIASAKTIMHVLRPPEAMPRCDQYSISLTLTTETGTLDRAKLSAAIDGRMGNDPEWFTHAFARPLATMHDVLIRCTGADCKTVPDFRTMMIAPHDAAPGMLSNNATPATPKVIPRDAGKENAATLGADFAENFLLQYTEGLPMSDVGWGRVDRAKLDELMEMNTRYHDFMLRTPLYAQQVGGPMAKKLLQFLENAAHSQTDPRVAYFSAHDANLTWLGGLLRMDWMVSDETFNATPPGSALVFELHHNAAKNEDTVRVQFVAQTLDQIRNLAPLTGTEKPSISPVYIPGCSGAAPQYDCKLEDFSRVINEATH